MVEFKNIAVVGVGGVGGFVGAMLAKYAQSKLQTQVYFIARGEHLYRISNEGLTLHTKDNSFKVKPTQIFDSLLSLDKPDLVFICTKSYDIEGITNDLAKISSEKTIVIPLLNGFDIYHRLKSKLPHQIILPSCIYITGYINFPGEVTIEGNGGKIVSGPDPDFNNLNYQPVSKLFAEANIHFKWVDNPFIEIWKKYIFVASFALISAAFEKTFFEIVNNIEMMSYLKAIISEMLNIAKVDNITFTEDIYEWAVGLSSKMPHESIPSFYRDIKNGRKCERDIFIDSLIAKAKSNSISIPVIEKLSKIVEQKIN
jgi:2-dehydropantoate 2-reductase